MIPNVDILLNEITEQYYPGRTYKLICKESYLANGVMSLAMSVDADDYDRLNGFTDGLDAVMQAIYFILSTERYKFIIYSWDYGVELLDLYGQQMPYVMAELPRRIKEALTQDNRIEDVTDFQFTKNGKMLHTTFTVVSNIGNISTEMEVEV